MLFKRSPIEKSHPDRTHANPGIRSLLVFLLTTYSVLSCVESAVPSKTPDAPGSFIRLKARTINTEKTPAFHVKLPNKLSSKAGPPRYYIVQRSGQISKTWRKSVAAQSKRVVGYLPDNALLVKASPEQIARISRLQGARWIGRYLPEYKISPSLGSLPELRRAGAFGDPQPCPVFVSAFPEIDVDSLVSAMQSLGCEVTSLRRGRLRNYLRVEALRSQIPAIANLDDVEWIERFHPFVLVAGGEARPIAAQAQHDIQTQITRAPEVWQRGLTGAGQTLAICDTGLDVGVKGTPMHDDLEGRVDATYALGREGLWNDPDGHGTHVAGTALGDGTLSSGAFRAPAYQSRLVFQSGYVSEEDPLGGVPVNLYELYKQVYDETEARIHSDSWGSPDRGAYSLFSAQTDEFIWDHKDFLLVFAAGNDGVDLDANGVIDRGSLYSPATAKNCVAVGASENVRDTGGLSVYTWGYLGFLEGTWSAPPISDDYVSDNEDGMAAFSSRGPCADGRIKPDIAAPGTDIIACRSQDPEGKQATAMFSWGVYDDYYVYMGGTSMAAPAVAGCAAIVRQFYTDLQDLENPSAALIKATLVNGAAEMSPGQYGSGDQQEMPFAPNHTEGWGRVDIVQSLFPEDSAVFQFVDEAVGLATDEDQVYEYVVGNSLAPFRATVAYSDYPASPAASIALVNNLDMFVTTPGGEIIYPNRQGGPDNLNNVESVHLSSPSPGIYRVTVAGTNVPQGPQPYALVASFGHPIGEAAISLDKAAYGQADTHFTVVVTDADLPPSASPLANVSSDSDPVGFDVALAPTALSEGVFQASILLNVSGSPEPDPNLIVNHGETIRVSYVDPDYGGAGSRQVSAMATVDLVSPEIFGVSVSQITEDSAVVTWSCSEDTTGLVKYGGNPTLAFSAADPVFAQSHAVTLVNLSENHVQYFEVHARDTAGNRTLDDNSGNLYTFYTRYTVSTFRDDMESGEGGWTHYGDADQWEHGSPTYTQGPPEAYSGDFCWGTRLAGYLEHDDYIFGYSRDEFLVSPPIAVDSSSTLVFRHWHDLVGDAVFGIYDYAYVEVTVDGEAWENITPNAAGAYTGATPGWIQEEIDLSAFAGRTVYIRFHLWADGWFDYLGEDYQYAGWYIDDVVVSSTKLFGDPIISLGNPYCTTAVPLAITLTDGERNSDPAQRDVVTVNAFSTTETLPEAILLTETGIDTGVFSGSLILQESFPIGGDGILQVTEGDSVTVSYENPGAGARALGGSAEAVAIVDLTPPSISNLDIPWASTDRATVRFTTEPTAAAAIVYSPPAGEEKLLVSHARTAERTFALQNLNENTLYHFRISVTDEAGNTSTYSSPPEDFAFGTMAEIRVAANAFDGVLSDWDFSADEVWELGMPGEGPPAAKSPPNCWGTDLDGFYPINCDASLTSDWVTLPANPQLRFSHWFSIDELGWEGAFGIVEISSDEETWDEASSAYAGATPDWLSATLDLSPWAGQRVQIRFRLWSEEADIVIYYYAGWYIDDVAVNDVVRFGRGTLVFDRAAYGLNVPVIVTLVDAHRNADPFTRETCSVTLSSSLESMTIELVETDISSGRFVAEVHLMLGPPAIGDTLLQVTAFDSITAAYSDEDDGSGAPAEVSISAPMDTIPPLITDLSIGQLTDTSALVTWTTDVEAIGSVAYDETPGGNFDRTVTEGSYSTQHSLRLSQLSENTTYYVVVSSVDRAQNASLDDNNGSLYTIQTLVRWEFFHDSLDAENSGWEHEGAGDVWQWGVPQYGVMAAHSPPDCWATNLSGTYPGLIDAGLISPTFNLKEGSQLRFWNWYGINIYDLDEGEGIVEIKPGAEAWQPLGQGGFRGSTDRWIEQQLDLSSFGEQPARIRFRLQADQWIDFFYPGWYIDDVTLSCLRPFGFGVVQLDRRVYAAPTTVNILLKDGHLNLDTTARETAQVIAASTFDPAGVLVELTETAENTAVFNGEVWLTLSVTPQQGELRVSYGDTITVLYLDADNALGETNVDASASATVWTPPSPIAPTIRFDGASVPPTLTLTWTPEPARTYRVYSRDSFLSGESEWRRSPGLPELLTPSLLGYTEPISPLSKMRFYRIEAW